MCEYWCEVEGLIEAFVLDAADGCRGVHHVPHDGAHVFVGFGNEEILDAVAYPNEEAGTSILAGFGIEWISHAFLHWEQARVWRDEEAQRDALAVGCDGIEAKMTRAGG